MQANASYDQRQADRWEEALRAKLAYRYHFMPDENPLPEGVTWAGLDPLARLDIMHEICEFRAVECPYVRHGIDRTVSPLPPPNMSKVRDPDAVQCFFGNDFPLTTTHP